MEEQQLTLGDRIKRLRLEFKKPYFCWTVLSNEQVLLTFEDERGQRLSFRGESMVKAVFNAESWSKIEEEKRERMERMKKEEENPKK